MIDTDLDVEDPRINRLVGNLGDLVLAGGHPYIMIRVPDLENGVVSVSHHGFDDDFDLPAALRELADAIEAS